MDDAIAKYDLPVGQSSRRHRSGADASRRPIVMVLGMHRSGTSLCSHILSMLGVDMTDNVPGPGSVSLTADNAKGHWERWEVVDFHDRILKLLNRPWDPSLHDLALPAAWWADPSVAQIKRELLHFVDRRMDSSLFGFKDPRTMRLLPLWRQVTDELHLEPKIILCLRNPAQVAHSLYCRDGLPHKQGEYRWLVHMADCFRHMPNVDFCTIEYETWFSDPLGIVHRLGEFLDMPLSQNDGNLELVLSDIIDTSLRHDDTSRRSAEQPLARMVHDLAKRAGADPAAREKLMSTCSIIGAMQHMQGPIQDKFEDALAVAAGLPALSQEVAGLRHALQERDQAMTASYAAAQESAASLEAVHAQLAQRQAEQLELQTNLASANQIRAELEAQITQLGTAAEFDRGATEAAQLKANGLGIERDQLQAELEALRQQHDEQATVLARTRIEQDELQAKLAAGDQDRAEMNAQIALLTSDVEGQRVATETAHKDVEAVCTELLQRQAELEDLYRQREEQARALEQAHSALDAKTAMLGLASQSCSDLENRLTQLQHDIERSAAAAREREVAEAAQKAALSGSLLQHETQLHQLNLASAESGRRESKLRADLSTARGDYAACLTNLEHTTRESANLRVQGSELQQQIDILRAEHAELRDYTSQAELQHEAALNQLQMKADLLESDLAASRSVGQALVKAVRDIPSRRPAPVKLRGMQKVLHMFGKRMGHTGPRSL